MKTRRNFLKNAGYIVLGAATFGIAPSLFLSSNAQAATYNFSLDQGEQLLRRYGLSSSSVKQGVAGAAIFSADYKTRGWVGGTTVTDSIGGQYNTRFEIRKINSKLAGVEVYQVTLKHVGRVIANSSPAGITLRSFFLKGGSKYIPLADYANHWYKQKDNNGYITLFDFGQKIAMMRKTQGRTQSFFCDGGTNCPRVGTNTHSAGELLARLLESNTPNPKLQWLKEGEPCHLVVSVGGSLHAANIYHRNTGVMMAIPGHGAFGIDYKDEGDFDLSMPGESLGLERGKVLKIKLTKK